MNDEYKQIVLDCAETGKKHAQNLANQGIINTMYLYFVPSEKGKAGKLILINDNDAPPEKSQLATGEGLRANVPYSNYYQWIFQRASRCPILSF